MECLITESFIRGWMLNTRIYSYLPEQNQTNKPRTIKRKYISSHLSQFSRWTSLLIPSAPKGLIFHVSASYPSVPIVIYSVGSHNSLPFLSLFFFFISKISYFCLLSASILSFSRCTVILRAGKAFRERETKPKTKCVGLFLGMKQKTPFYVSIYLLLGSLFTIYVLFLTVMLSFDLKTWLLVEGLGLFFYYYIFLNEGCDLGLCHVVGLSFKHGRSQGGWW